MVKVNGHLSSVIISNLLSYLSNDNFTSLLTLVKVKPVKMTVLDLLHFFQWSVESQRDFLLE